MNLLTPSQVPASRSKKNGGKSGWRRVKFGDVVRFVKEDADPNSGEFERYVAGEHIETDNLHIRFWGIIGDGYLGPAFHRKFVRGQVLYGSRRTYLRKIAVADFDGITVPVHDILGEDYPDNQRATVECSRDTPGGFGLEVGMIPLRGGRWDGGLFPGWYPRSRVGKA